ncbi:probable JmjC domain-containing histone demethylation protein 2C [Agrilus planipennis]|uniref:Probable JmjC domain-containing histone demethylation protein 2C n=1 Tax=Agrilus planipennis TaxID=224129 RepID=A0A7F5RN81_AGRPL|nr:probable JmjC domain-containing histone demethylation protein 2C [Agrilus planipennis]
MALKCREEVVGKRFLSVSGCTKLKIDKIREWGWRSGVIRAASHRDNTNKDLQVLVEYDGVEWKRREWISVYGTSFKLFFVEQDLLWFQREVPFSYDTLQENSDNATSTSVVSWPVITFTSLISSVVLPSHLYPAECLVDRELVFIDYDKLETKPLQEIPINKECLEARTAVKRWHEQQDGQKILLTTPSVLVGYRVEVYRSQGTTQWYTAVIIGYNETTRDLTVTDDTVLEEHNVDPTLVQMRLIGDGVVESIMRGENVGITPRRSRSTAVLQAQQHHHHHNNRQQQHLPITAEFLMALVEFM